MEDNYKNYTPLSEKIKDLENQGFKSQYKVENGRLIDISRKSEYNPQDVRIKDKFRFEGESNPDDMSILYALECKDGGKGTLVNAYGFYANDEIDQFLTEVPDQNPRL